MTTLLRRDGLLVACALLVCACVCADAEDKPQLSADVAPALPERSIKLFNTHTNETVAVCSSAATA
ncbi:MAG: hypothetical protein H7Y89_14535 [Steroidobacteraceae bacterium]|nr:hypothetical protein [Steroidobacteraceae bacterium]